MKKSSMRRAKLGAPSAGKFRILETMIRADVAVALTQNGSVIAYVYQEAATGHLRESLQTMFAREVCINPGKYTGKDFQHMRHDLYEIARKTFDYGAFQGRYFWNGAAWDVTLH